MSDGDTFEIEFDRLARWTADAIRAGSPDDAVPGACNGSGQPSALGWLADALRLGPEMRLVDTGAGLGGPAAWIGQRYGVVPLVSEPMAEAAQGAHQLFGLPAVVAWAHQLPFAPGSVDAALALAVLSTATDKVAFLREVHRILRPGGGLGLLEYVLAEAGGAGATDGRPDPADVPANNDLVGPGELRRLLGQAGFALVDTVAGASLAPSPPEWTESEERVRRRVEAARGGDPALDEAAEQEARFGRLLRDGSLQVRLVHAVAVAPPVGARGQPH